MNAWLPTYVSNNYLSGYTFTQGVFLSVCSCPHHLVVNWYIIEIVVNLSFIIEHVEEFRTVSSSADEIKVKDLYQSKLKPTNKSFHVIGLGWKVLRHQKNRFCLLRRFTNHQMPYWRWRWIFKIIKDFMQSSNKCSGDGKVEKEIGHKVSPTKHSPPHKKIRHSLHNYKRAKKSSHSHVWPHIKEEEKSCCQKQSTLP